MSATLPEPTGAPGPAGVPEPTGSPGPARDRLASGTIVVREYQDDAPIGLVGEWMDAHGLAWRVSRPADEPTLAEPAAAIIALGASASAYWTDPAWIGEEAEMLAAATQAGTPVLGICFGAQALARGLGGEVARAAVPEVGYVNPASDVPELAGPYLAWHFDSITLPPDADVLARTPAALQVFTRGSAMGWQFHPEVTPAIWSDWAANGPRALAKVVADPEELAAQIATCAPLARERTFALMDWWRAWVAARG